jgi:hypothetical protein
MITATKNPRDDRSLTRELRQGESPLKDDRHLNILRLVADHKQRELQQHDNAADLSGSQPPAQRRRRRATLERNALRARAHIEAAEARRMQRQRRF